MKDKIYKYLIAKNKSVPTNEIIETFFHTPGHYPIQMEQIIESMLKGDERFISDKFGEWSARKCKQRYLTDSIFSIIELETLAINKRKKLPILLGIAQIKNLKVIYNQIFSIKIPLEYSPKLNNKIKQFSNLFSIAGSFSSHAQEIYRLLQDTIFVHYAPAKVLARLNYFFRIITGLELEMVTISLARVARKLISGIKFRSIEDLAFILNLPWSEPNDLKERMNLMSDIHIHLLEELAKNLINTYEDLVQFLEKGERVIDFDGYKFDREYIKRLPQTPGVYLMKDRNNKVFYVGKSKNLRARVESYFVDRSEMDEKAQKILTNLTDINYQQVGSELEALLLEHQFIKQFQPELNTQIAIHPFELSSYRNKNIILFLPGLDDNAIAMFFIKGTDRATKIYLNRNNPNWHLCNRLLSEYYFKPQQEQSQFSKEEIEIIWRWLSLNRESVNYIDIDQVGTPKNCLDKLKEYIADSELTTQKIYYL